MVAPNGPDDETWKKMSKGERRVHKALNYITIALIAFLFLEYWGAIDAIVSWLNVALD
jgi:hypothetical protein